MLGVSSQSKLLPPPGGKLPEISSDKFTGLTVSDNGSTASEVYGLGQRGNSVSKPSILQRKNMLSQGISAAGSRPSNTMTIDAGTSNNKKPCDNCGRQFNSKMLQLHVRSCTRGNIAS